MTQSQVGLGHEDTARGPHVSLVSVTPKGPGLHEVQKHYVGITVKVGESEAVACMDKWSR